MNPKFNKNFKYIQNIPNIKKDMYLISNSGELYSLYKEKIYGPNSKAFIKPYIDKDGYERVGLVSKNGKPRIYTKGIHTLVISTFKGNPPTNIKDPTVNHIDGNTKNNNISNLEWIERKENSNINYRRFVASGEYNGGNIYSKDKIKEVIDYKIKHPEIGCYILHNKFGISVSQIWRIIKKEIWKHLTEIVEFNILNHFENKKQYIWGYRNEEDELTMINLNGDKEYTYFNNEYTVNDIY